MAEPCEQLERFADGEMPADESERFRDHLLGCARCRMELEHVLQLDQLVDRHVERHGRSEAPAPSAWTARRRWIGAGAFAGLAVVAVAVVLARRAPAVDPWLMAEPERRVDVRIAYPAVDRHRPLASRSMGGAGAASPPLPLEAMAALQREGDGAGLAAAFLLRNDRGLAEQALATLAPLGDSPEIEADRAAAYLVIGDADQALRRADLALEGRPGLTPALWNRALALAALDLRRSAALAFHEVERLGEPGWAEEARRRASDLEAAEQARWRRWQAVMDAGDALVHSGSLPPAAILADRPPVLRLFFYDAVRTRTSRQEVESLLPLARELDAQAGGDVLARYVARVASSDFSRRAPLARAYADLSRKAVPSEQVPPLLERFLRSGEDDLAIGALVQAGAVATHLDAFAARAEATGDPWFAVMALDERANDRIASGQTHEARQSLEQASALCARSPLVYRCLLVELNLALADAGLARLDEAWAHAEHAFRQGRETNELARDDVALGHLAQLSRVRGDLPLARAYLEELVQEDRGNADVARYAHQNLAQLALNALRFDEGRAQIDRALATGLPLTPTGAMALSDIARRRPSPTDEQALERALSAARPTASPGQQAVLEHALGRFLLERDRARGRERLEGVIRASETGDLWRRDEDARRARAYSYTSLIFDEAKAGSYAGVLDLFGREVGKLPDRCMVAVAEDSERSLLAVRGSTGALMGEYQGDRVRPLPEDLSGLVGPQALKALEGCSQVGVFARPPLQGRARLLPSAMAWSYQVRTEDPPAPPAGRRVHLVVRNAEMAPERLRALGRLNAWEPSIGGDEDRRVLEGAEATPSHVLAYMRDATEIDLAVHGIVSPYSGASYLVLAPEGARDALSAEQIGDLDLRRAPLVILAACHAARAAPLFYDSISLPSAFVRAGARGVIAATREIPDLEAAGFFNAVRQRIRGGSPPAAAVRDERIRWLAEQKGRTWLDDVLVYE